VSDEHVKALVSYRLEQADDARIERAIRDLEHLGEHRLMEANHAATGLLLKGTMAAHSPSGSSILTGQRTTTSWW
jgi:hypothetical protein